MTPVLALALTAGGADTEPASDMVVKDSAGVRIVQHRASTSKIQQSVYDTHHPKVRTT